MSEVFAFVVGIDKYQQPGWDVPGPCANAIAIIKWLHSIGVSMANIHAFLSPIEPFEGEIVPQLKYQTADFGGIDTFWRTTLKQAIPPNARLLVYWSGHGFVQADGSRIFICSDFTADGLKNRVFNGSKFIRHLQLADYPCFCEPILLADVCGVHTGIQFDDAMNLPANAKSIWPLPLACFATPEGVYAHGDNGRGEFTRILLEVLSKFESCPAQADLKQWMREAFDQAGQIQPFSVAIEDSEGNTSHWVGADGNALFQAVYALLSPFLVSDADYLAHYLPIVNDLGNPKLACAKSLSQMLRELVSLADGLNSNKLSRGLIQFLLRLCQREELKAAIDGWLAQKAVHQGNDIATERAKIEAERQQMILVIEVEIKLENQEICAIDPVLLNHRLVSVSNTGLTRKEGIPLRQSKEFRAGDWNQFGADIRTVIGQLKAQSMDNFAIHFFIDPPLFDRSFHQISLENGETLGENFIVLVHHRERFRNQAWKFRKNWVDYADRLRLDEPGQIKLLPVPLPDNAAVHPEGEKGLCYTRFTVPDASANPFGSQEKKILMALIKLGVPYLHWRHAPFEDGSLEDIESFLAGKLKNLNSLDEFPQAYTNGRINGNLLACQATLLWDDPQFQPFLKQQGVKQP